jgi:hypothetical protein
MMAHVARGLPELAPDLPADLRDVSEDVRAVMVHYGPFDLARSRPFPDGYRPGGRAPRRAARRSRLGASRVALSTTPRTRRRPCCSSTARRTRSSRIASRCACTTRSSRRDVRPELLLLEGAPHAFQIEWRGAANRRANEAMDVFLEQHL